MGSLNFLSKFAEVNSRSGVLYRRNPRLTSVIHSQKSNSNDNFWRDSTIVLEWVQLSEIMKSLFYFFLIVCGFTCTLGFYWPVLYVNRMDPVQSLWMFQNLVWNGLTSFCILVNTNYFATPPPPPGGKRSLVATPCYHVIFIVRFISLGIWAFSQWYLLLPNKFSLRAAKLQNGNHDNQHKLYRDLTAGSRPLKKYTEAPVRVSL